MPNVPVGMRYSASELQLFNSQEKNLVQRSAVYQKKDWKRTSRTVHVEHIALKLCAKLINHSKQ